MVLFVSAFKIHIRRGMLLKAAALAWNNPGPLTLGVCCRRHLVKAVHGKRSNSYSHKSRAGKRSSREFHFYFKCYFVNMFVLLLCSGVLAQSRIPACRVLAKAHPCPPLDNIISWQPSMGRHGETGRAVGSNCRNSRCLCCVKVLAATWQKGTCGGGWNKQRMKELKKVLVEITKCQSTLEVLEKFQQNSVAWLLWSDRKWNVWWR